MFKSLISSRNRPRLGAKPLFTAVLAGASIGISFASEDLIHNGGFEQGFKNWTLASSYAPTDYLGDPGGSGGYYIQGSSGQTPVSGLSALAPSEGSNYALADQTASGQFALYQQFTVPKGASSIVLSYSQYVYDWSGTPAVGSDLSYTGDPNQQARVDLLLGDSKAFSIANSDVVATFYANAESPSDPSFVTYTEDITNLLTPGSTYMLRFAVVENQFVLSQGIDDVHVQVKTVPGPAGAQGFAVLGLTALVRRRRRSKRFHART